MKEFIDKLISRLKERENHYRCEVEKVKRFSKIRICRELQMRAYETSIKIVNELAEEYINTSTDTSSGWIAFTQRELTEEEKEHYGEDVEYMLDCKLPEEDEEILVTYKWKDEFYVGNDTFLRDGSECYLDSGRDFITEAIAWQPLPAPYKEGE